MDATETRIRAQFDALTVDEKRVVTRELEHLGYGRFDGKRLVTNSGAVYVIAAPSTIGSVGD